MASHKGQVRKRCEICGAFLWCRRERTQCWRSKFGPGSVLCSGFLTPTAKQKEPKPKAEARPQEVAARRMVIAQRSIDHWVERVADAARNLRRAQLKAKRFAKLAALTDAQVAERSEKARQALANRKTRRRGIRLEGEL